MALAIGDILAAKMLVQLGWIAVERAQVDLAALDRRQGHLELLVHYAGTGVLDVERAARVRRYVELYYRVRREALYLGLLERAQLLSTEDLERWKGIIEKERYARRLGELLVFSHRLTREQDAELSRQQASGLERENARVLEGYRKARFEGVSRPVTKNPKARLETGVFTIKNLFRSQESQRLARMAATGDGPAGSGTGPELPVPNVPRERPTLDLGRAAQAVAVTVPERPAFELPGAAAEPPPAPPPLEPGVPARVGPWVIESVLGRGGMGIVLLGSKPGEPGRVAIKLGLSKEDEYRQRLRREILATSMLHHENIVSVLDAGEIEDGSPYLVMELVRGRELREVLRERGALPPRDALAIFVQILGAAGAAHRAGIVHRDLKPENVLVTETGGNYFAKLMDFGLARIVEMDPDHKGRIFETVATNVVSGSPHYLSPEQILGDAVDGRTDLYAAGVILFELLTGALPFPGETLGEVVRAHVQRAPRRLSEARPGAFPEALEHLVASLLEKQPQRRPPDAGSVIRVIEERVVPALDLAASGTAVSPAPPAELARTVDEPPPVSLPGSKEPRPHRGITTVLSRLFRRGPPGWPGGPGAPPGG